MFVILKRLLISLFAGTYCFSYHVVIIRYKYIVILADVYIITGVYRMGKPPENLTTVTSKANFKTKAFSFIRHGDIAQW